MQRLIALAFLFAVCGFIGCGSSANSDPAVTVNGVDPEPMETETESAEPIDVALEGTWRGQLIVDETEAKKANPDAVALLKSMKMEMTFREDGTLNVTGETNGQTHESENRWDLVSVEDNKLTIKSIGSDGSEKNLDFYFNNSDSFDMPLSIETAQLGAMRFTRLR